MCIRDRHNTWFEDGFVIVGQDVNAVQVNDAETKHDPDAPIGVKVKFTLSPEDKPVKL